MKYRIEAIIDSPNFSGGEWSETPDDEFDSLATAKAFAAEYVAREAQGYFEPGKLDVLVRFEAIDVAPGEDGDLKPGDGNIHLTIDID